MTTIQTTAVRTYHDKKKQQRPLSIPIVQAVNFEAESSVQLGEDFRNGTGFVYQRFGHPTTKAAGEKIALLEGAEAGLVFSSGMGAIATTLMALIGGSDARVIAQRQIFAQTFTFLDKALRSFGVETTFIDVRNEVELRAAFQTRGSLLYIESPSNPLLNVVDIRRAAAIAHEHGALLLVDSTFASPFLQNPIALGADIVLHSATKFLGGHSDVLCGAVAGPAGLVKKIEQMQILLGTVLDPHASWLLLRGIKTLGVRVQRQAENALALARLLQRHDAVESVEYPWLESSRSFPVASKQMRGGGGVLTFTLKGGLEAAHQFSDALELISVATSLGGVESVIEIPADLDFGPDELGDTAGESGIPKALIRLSVGIEDIGDLVADVEHALAAVSAAVATTTHR
jgi:cystathionine beta-lyase/cystathionine gamma-synthase